MLFEPQHRALSGRVMLTDAPPERELLKIVLDREKSANSLRGSPLEYEPEEFLLVGDGKRTLIPFDDSRSREYTKLSESRTGDPRSHNIIALEDMPTLPIFPEIVDFALVTSNRPLSLQEMSGKSRPHDVSIKQLLTIDSDNNFCWLQTPPKGIFYKHGTILGDFLDQKLRSIKIISETCKQVNHSSFLQKKVALIQRGLRIQVAAFKLIAAKAEEIEVLVYELLREYACFDDEAMALYFEVLGNTDAETASMMVSEDSPESFREDCRIAFAITPWDTTSRFKGIARLYGLRSVFIDCAHAAHHVFMRIREERQKKVHDYAVVNGQLREEMSRIPRLRAEVSQEYQLLRHTAKNFIWRGELPPIITTGTLKHDGCGLPFTK